MVGPCEVVVLPLQNHGGHSHLLIFAQLFSSSIASSQEGSGGCGGGDVIVAGGSRWGTDY